MSNCFFRNINNSVRLDKQNLNLHLCWGIPSVCLVACLGGWYAMLSRGEGIWLGGGSLPGLVCGTISGGIVAFEMLLWPRKVFRRWRLIATKHWLAAHLWFGLASLPIAVIHSGFHLGGTLPSVFMVLFTLTIISGVYGWLMQHFIPQLLLSQVPAETIYSQIELVSRRNVADLHWLLVSALGPPPQDLAQGENGLVDSETHESRSTDNRSTQRRAAVVVGAVRDTGRVRGKTLRTTVMRADPRHANDIWHAFYEARTFMLHGHRQDDFFADQAKSSKYFSNLRRICGVDCAEIINSLEEYCNQRRQFDLQKRLQHWLTGWLPIHIGLSVSVSVLLIVHTITAIRYW